MDILIVAARTRVEKEMAERCCSESQLGQQWRKEGEKTEELFNQHKLELGRRKMAADYFPEAKFIQDNELEVQISQQLVIALGDDRHFIHVSHYAGNSTIFPIDINPERINDRKQSLLYCCPWTSYSLWDALERIEKGDYAVENWPRLQAILDQRTLAPATSEYFAGEKDRTKQSRYLSFFRGKETLHESSGLVIATGVGSVRWYDAASRFLLGSDRWEKSSRQASYIASEPKVAPFTEGLTGILREDEQLFIHSLCKEGICCADQTFTAPFPRGSTVTISLHPKPLAIGVPI